MRLSDSSEEDVQYRASWQGENDKVFPKEKKKAKRGGCSEQLLLPVVHGGQPLLLAGALHMTHYMSASSI